MKKFYSVFVAALFFIASNAQQTTFRIQYNYTQFDFPTGIVQAPSGNYIFSSFEFGLSIPLGPRGGLTEVNQNGTHVRSTLYNNGAFTTTVDFNDVKNATGGGYIVTGDANGQCLLAKIPAAFGAPTWQYRYTPASGASAYGNKVIQATDGGFVVAGAASGVDPGNGAGVQDSSKMFCFKTDASGNLLWMKVFFYTTAFDDDDYLEDVVEVSDGYVFVGSANMVGNDGQSDAVVLKTDLNGNFQWARRFGNSNSEDVQSVIQDAGNNIVMSGLDNLGAYIYNWNAPNSGPSVIGTNTRYYGTGLPVTASDLTKTFDNNFALFATGISLPFTSIVAKANRSTGAVMFAKSYNSFISILPTGIQAADSGFLMNSISADTTSGGGAYDFGVIKTDINGNQGGTGCAASNPTILTQAYSPTVNTFTPIIITTSQRNSGGITGVTATPSTVIGCLAIACTHPPTPTLTANPNTSVCPNTSVTLSASGGTNVTYRYYTVATGGTAFASGTSTVVTPSVTTTYYAEADDNANPGCVSSVRASVTVTVNQPPGAIGSITGQTSPCLGSKNYSITAVTGTTPITYTWSVSGGGSIVSGQGTTGVVINWTAIGGPYTVSVTASNSCGTTSATLAVNVVGSVSGVGATASANPICAGSTLALTGSGSGVSSWSWSGPNGFTASTQNTSVPNITTAGAGTYTLNATGACGSGSASVTVAVNSPIQNLAASASPNDTVCAGATISLNASGTNVTTWSWSGPNSFSASTQNTSVANSTAASSGTYTVTASNACGSPTVSINVLVNNSVSGFSASATGNGTICTGTALNFTATGTNVNAWSWSGPNGFSSVLQNPSINPAHQNNSGTYTLIAYNACGNQTTTVNVQVDTSIQNLSSSASPNDTVCSGGTINLSASGTNVTSWSWSGPSGFSASTQNTPVANLTTTNSGTYTVTASNACGNSTSGVSVLVNNPITGFSANATSNGIVCSGTAINFTATGTNVNAWSWSGPNGFSSALQNPSINPAHQNNSGTYTLTAYNACGNQTTTVNVQVDTVILNLSASASPNDTVCSGGTINLNASGTNVTSWSWSGPNGFTASTQNTSVTNSTTDATGTYTVTASNACGNSTSSVLVLVNNAIAGLSASATSDGVVCTGSTLNLTASGSNVNGWSWSGPNGFSSTQQNPTISPALQINSGIYTLTAFNACSNQTATVTVQVDTLIENLSASASPGDTVCEGATINLSANGTNVTSWSWSGPNNFSSAQQNTSVANAQANASGTYIITGSNACGNSSSSVNILVNTIPSAPGTINGSLNPCGNDSASYNISSVANATTYTWTLGGGGTITSGQGTNSITVNWGSTSGSYTVSVTASNDCGGSSASTLTVNLQSPAPIMNSVIVGDTGVCPGISLYSIANIPNATSYTWTVSGGGTISTGQGTNSINVNWTTPGTHTVSVTASNTCGSSSAANIPVNVHPAPSAAVVTLTGDTICEGNSTTITATGSVGGNISYNFYSAATGGNLLGTSPLTVSPTVTTTYYLEVINEFGCAHAAGRRPVTVVVTPAPTVLGIVASDDTICHNGFATLTANSSSGSTITWYDAPAGGNVLGTGNVYATNFLTQTTTYYAEATSTGGCVNLQGRVSATVVVRSQVVVALTSDHDHNTIFQNEVLIFTAVPDSFEHYDFYVNGNLMQSESKNTYASSSYNDLDSVWVIATMNGCASARAEDTVHVVDFPNAFTPNSDGVNDVFLQGYDLVILNRWGQELYRGMEGWDGRFKGDKVSPGTYYYVVQLADITDRKTTIKGTVLLIED